MALQILLLLRFLPYKSTLLSPCGPHECFPMLLCTDTTEEHTSYVVTNHVTEPDASEIAVYIEMGTIGS